MDETKKDVSAEELAAEQAALQVDKEDEIRSKVIAEFGFDEVDDIERIDKLVAKEVESRKKLSDAIGQKIKWRTEATKSKETVPPVEKKKETPPDLDVRKVLAEELEQRDLDAMDYSPELKKEIKRVADITGVPIRQAIRDPYIASKIQDYERENEAEEASITKTNRSGGKKTVSLENPPEVDMSTEEGRKKWDEYKRELIKKGY